MFQNLVVLSKMNFSPEFQILYFKNNLNITGSEKNTAD